MDTSAPPGALLTGLVMSLLSLSDDCGALFGFTSTKTSLASFLELTPGSIDAVLALLRPVVPHALALSLALSAGGLLGSGALQRFSWSAGVVVPPALLAGDRGVLFGFTSTKYRVAFLRAHSWLY